MPLLSRLDLAHFDLIRKASDITIGRVTIWLTAFGIGLRPFGVLPELSASATRSLGSPEWEIKLRRRAVPTIWT